MSLLLVPEIIILTIGLIVSFKKRESFPETCRIVITALAISLSAGILSAALTLFFADTASYAWLVLGILFSLARTTTFALLIYAVWKEREN